MKPYRRPLPTAFLWTLLCCCLAVALPAPAATVDALESNAIDYSFNDPELQQRYDELLRQLRCLVCQNQSLADSASDLAGDLRTDVYTMITTGQSNDQIIATLRSRYGDFVSYDPPVRAATLPLWFVPPVLLLLAVLLAWRGLRAPAADDDNPL